MSIAFTVAINEAFIVIVIVLNSTSTQDFELKNCSNDIHSDDIVRSVLNNLISQSFELSLKIPEILCMILQLTVSPDKVHYDLFRSFLFELNQDVFENSRLRNSHLRDVFEGIEHTPIHFGSIK